MAKQVFRKHFRAQVIPQTFENRADEFTKALEEAQTDCKSLFKADKALVAALFRKGDTLFAYCESLGEEFAPEAFFGALSPYLLDWPGEEGPRKWAYMTPVWYHAIPIDEDDWTRAIDTNACHGRLAYLKPDGGIARYVWGHKALTDEGALKGDKFTSIGLHENILFQYMEQREVITNVSRDPDLVCKHLPPSDPANPGRYRQPLSSWLYPDGIPFMTQNGEHFAPVEKLFCAAKLEK